MGSMTYDGLKEPQKDRVNPADLCRAGVFLVGTNEVSGIAGGFLQTSSPTRHKTKLHNDEVGTKAFCFDHKVGTQNGIITCMRNKWPQTRNSRIVRILEGSRRELAFAQVLCLSLGARIHNPGYELQAWIAEKISLANVKALKIFEAECPL